MASNHTDIEKYTDRKNRVIKVLNSKLKDANDMYRFIELVIEGKIILNRRPIKDVKSDLDKYELPYTVLKLSISKLTKEELEELLKNIEGYNKEIDYITRTTTTQMYINDLKALRKDLAGEGFEYDADKFKSIEPEEESQKQPSLFDFE